MRAVAVNSYGKVSNEMSVELRINNVKFQNYYRAKDTIDCAVLMKTTQSQFVKRFGEPEKEEPITDSAIRGTCTRLTYPWGEARFYAAETGTLLYYLDTTSASFSGPRNTRVGSAEKGITDAFRDLGQADNQDGSRSLYHDSKEKCIGKINILADGSKRIDYSYVDSEFEATITLSYYLTDGKCTRIVNSFVSN